MGAFKSAVGWLLFWCPLVSRSWKLRTWELEDELASVSEELQEANEDLDATDESLAHAIAEKMELAYRLAKMADTANEYKARAVRAEKLVTAYRGAFPYWLPPAGQNMEFMFLPESDRRAIVYVGPTDINIERCGIGSAITRDLVSVNISLALHPDTPPELVANDIAMRMRLYVLEAFAKQEIPSA